MGYIMQMARCATYDQVTCLLARSSELVRSVHTLCFMGRTFSFTYSDCVGGTFYLDICEAGKVRKTCGVAHLEREMKPC